MVGDLEQIPAATVARDGLEDIFVVIVLQVTGEQDPLLPHGEAKHDRGAVDGAPVGQDAIRQGVARRPQDLDANIAQRQQVAPQHASPRNAVASGGGTKLDHAGSLAVHAGLDKAADRVARE